MIMRILSLLYHLRFYAWSLFSTLYLLLHSMPDDRGLSDMKVMCFSRSSGALPLAVNMQWSINQALVLLTLSASVGLTFAGM